MRKNGSTSIQRADAICRQEKIKKFKQDRRRILVLATITLAMLKEVAPANNTLPTSLAIQVC
jgi:hypothetical protein